MLHAYLQRAITKHVHPCLSSNTVCLCDCPGLPGVELGNERLTTDLVVKISKFSKYSKIKILKKKRSGYTGQNTRSHIRQCKETQLHDILIQTVDLVILLHLYPDTCSLIPTVHLLYHIVIRYLYPDLRVP